MDVWAFFEFGSLEVPKCEIDWEFGIPDVEWGSEVWEFPDMKATALRISQLRCPLVGFVDLGGRALFKSGSSGFMGAGVVSPVQGFGSSIHRNIGSYECCEFEISEI